CRLTGHTQNLTITHQAGGTTEVFSTLRGQALGQWLLAFVAVGLFAFGVYSLLTAVYRRINPSL
ncbi:DUF1206 domain-containing protein, partial [Halomonas meridiana]|uniref:DUF1206 domain-containing protein n=1 Tax=Vreelandella aquamarina TaxID=77097 RepID=UPI001E3F4DC3